MVFRKITYSIFSLVFHFIFLHLISFATKHHKDVYDSKIKPCQMILSKLCLIFSMMLLLKNAREVDVFKTLYDDINMGTTTTLVLLCKFPAP